MTAPLRASLLVVLSFWAGADRAASAQALAQMGPVWPKLSAAERDQVMRYGDDFKRFMGRAKSAQTFVREIGRAHV